MWSLHCSVCAYTQPDGTKLASLCPDCGQPLLVQIAAAPSRDSITGDALPAAHGTRDMPVWGRVYREDAATYYMELPYDPDAYTRAQVLMLLEYVHRLQQK